MAETKSKLPKELQTFKREMKKATFEEKVKRYFSISPVIEEYSEEKKEIITDLFTSRERMDFLTDYYPIRLAIADYEDRIRTTKSVIDFTAYYIDSLLRITSIYTYMGEFTDYALQYLKEETGRNDSKTAKHLRSLRSITPGFTFDYDQTKGEYLPKEDFTKEIEANIEGLKRGLSLIKAYFSSLREFLDMVKQPQLFPKEFKEVEDRLFIRFQNFATKEIMENKKKAREISRDYPKLRTPTEVEIKAVSIDYKEIEPQKGFMGIDNPWMNSYKSHIE